jgi:hypothetical protein
METGRRAAKCVIYVMLRSNIAEKTASLSTTFALLGHPAKLDRGSAKPANTGVGEVSKSAKL